MDILNNYFSSLVFKYIEEKSGFAVYVAAIHTMLGGDKTQYIIAFVPSHLKTKNSGKLHTLQWVNLQARLLSGNAYKVITQSWKAPTLSVTNLDLHIVERKKEHSVYRADNFPFEVLMIHSQTKKTTFQYPNNMNLHWAIDQFQTIFNYVCPEPQKNFLIGTQKSQYPSNVFESNENIEFINS